MLVDMWVGRMYISVGFFHLGNLTNYIPKIVQGPVDILDAPVNRSHGTTFISLAMHDPDPRISTGIGM